MNPMRAYCVALSAALTVLLASQLGIPVSTTHIAVGAVFGVGFFREYYTANSTRRRYYVRTHKLRRYPVRVTGGPEDKLHRKLVRRSHFVSILAAWAITVPTAAGLSALIFMCIRYSAV